MDFIEGIEEKYPKELLENRLAIEGCVIGCIYKDVLCLDEIQLKDEYFKIYWDCINYLKEKLTPDNSKDIFELQCIPDIVYEQQVLQDLCEYKGYTTKFVIPSATKADLIDYANEIGYQHVLGGKYKEQNLHFCIQILSHLSPIVYRKLYNVLKDYLV